jgi:hypothetical protein
MVYRIVAQLDGGLVKGLTPNSWMSVVAGGHCAGSAVAAFMHTPCLIVIVAEP